jgi:type VI secretion system protein ImpA
MSLLEAFFSPRGRDSPAGADLRNDPRFHALERRMESASRDARRENGGTEPAIDWQQVIDDAAALAEDGRDLRLIVIVTRALANRDGLPGLAEGLGLLGAAVGDCWEELHPALRDLPSPREAAVRRINALHQLESETEGVLCDLEHNTLFAPRVLGPVTGGDLAAAALASGAFTTTLPRGLGAAEQAALVATHEARVARVRTACKALAAEMPDRLAELKSGAALAREALAHLEDVMSKRIAENGVGFRLQALGGFLDRLAATLAAAGPEPKGETAMTPAAGPAAAAMPAAASTAPAQALPGAISSRQEVERCLEMIIEFYERTEPASPIPLLARRMRKMVPMSFLQLMEEVAPSGMKEFRSIAGVPDEKTR